MIDAGSLYTTVGNALKLITPANVTDPIEFWLAFLLILAILNTVLKNVSFFKDKENKNARALVSLIISFFAVTAAWVSPILAYMSSTLAITAIGLVAILIVAALAGYDQDKISASKWQKVMLGAAVAVLFFGGFFSYFVVPASTGAGGSSGGVAGTGSSISSVIATAFSNPSTIGLLVLVAFAIGVGVFVFGGSK
jgi:hypothetical protein